MNLPYIQGNIVDLTHSYSSDTIYWPTEEEGFKLEKEFDGMTESGYYYAANKFTTPEHGGTHIDAPIHFAKQGQTIDQVSLERLLGIAIVVDVSKEALKNRDYQISVQDFINWESSFGKIADGTIVLLHTGYGKFWPDRLKYIGTNTIGESALDELHFPGLHPDATKWLLENCNINAVGIDTQSIDYGQSKLFQTHRLLCEKNIPFFENIANLDQLPPIGAYVIALPMKIQGGSGAPLRIIAINPNKS